jgi:hypothetical protein
LLIDSEEVVPLEDVKIQSLTFGAEDIDTTLGGFFGLG